MSVRKIIWYAFLVALVMNFSSLTMTSFMITFWPCQSSGSACVGEANYYPAVVFEQFGIPVMYLILGFIWLCLFVIFRALSKADEELDVRAGLFIQVVLLAIMFWIFVPDFIANINTLWWIVNGGIW